MINVAGLAIGMACCVLILLFIKEELSYDKFHTKADQIYRIAFSSSDDGLPSNANGSFGIVKNIPRNSQIHFDFLASYISQKEDLTDFSGYQQNYTYALLNKNSSVESLNSKFLEFLQRNWKSDPWYTICLQPILDIRLHSRLRSEVEPTGNILYIYIFTAIAVFILIIACINFMNLTTACSLNRAKEVCVRKVVGAKRKQLIRQFLGESLLLSIFSVGIAFLFVLTAMPLFNRLTDKHLTPASFMNPGFIAGVFSISLVVGLAAGIYPLWSFH